MCCPRNVQYCDRIFWWYGGCAMIGQSMINVKSGGRTRIAGIAAALFLLSFILFASRLIEQIPLAALVGVMFMVVIGTFAWQSLKILRKIPLSDALVIIVVTAVTVATDLAIAVIVGVMMSALVFAWQSARHMSADVKMVKEGTKEYHVYGPLFFGSIESFNALFDPKSDPKNVIIDFEHSRVWDHSGLQAIDALAEKYQKLGKTLHLRHLSEDCRHLLRKAGNLVEVSVIEDPTYEVAVDYSDEYK